MSKLMKKVLTDKKARNTTALMTFLMSATEVGEPWDQR